MARFIASRRIVGWERGGGDKPADEWDRAILDDGAFVAASDLPDAPSAASIDFEASVTLLAADALAFTKPLTELRRKVIVDALREAARGGITEERETYWLDRMLSVGCHVTAPFREDGWVNDGFGI